jgi:hypothetical protein
MQNCQGNGRPDKEYENWRWKPLQCDLPRFDAKKFLELMRGKTIAFIGDSVARNHMESLLCILWQAIIYLYYDLLTYTFYFSFIGRTIGSIWVITSTIFIDAWLLLTNSLLELFVPLLIRMYFSLVQGFKQETENI